MTTNDNRKSATYSRPARDGLAKVLQTYPFVIRFPLGGEHRRAAHHICGSAKLTFVAGIDRLMGFRYYGGAATTGSSAPRAGGVADCDSDGCRGTPKRLVMLVSVGG